MQTSGTFPQLSDGGKKTVTTQPPVKPMPAVKAAPATSHRRGGFQKHAKGGK